MVFSLITAVAMAVGVLFLQQINKTLGNIGQGGPFLFIALMFAWDGIFIYMMKSYASKEELAIGIILGTLLKVPTLLKTFKS